MTGVGPKGFVGCIGGGFVTTCCIGVGLGVEVNDVEGLFGAGVFSGGIYDVGGLSVDGRGFPGVGIGGVGVGGMGVGGLPVGGIGVGGIGVGGLPVGDPAMGEVSDGGVVYSRVGGRKGVPGDGFEVIGGDSTGDGGFPEDGGDGGFGEGTVTGRLVGRRDGREVGFIVVAWLFSFERSEYASKTSSMILKKFDILSFAYRTSRSEHALS
mmetsp:Transcript_13846/g.29234  ORF Transcript_13846/g.29234 Transcript_13846/m.29234 type:complete len:210 (-) Transcript_13846:418-1047(-)